jgi:SAM-dependent methyltransferase
MPRVSELSRQYVKLCDLRDFEDPAVVKIAHEILPERDPAAHAERKVWEFSMLALFLEEVGRLHDGTRALAVGAGDERIVFWLANRVGRVVATDIYGEGQFAEHEAAASMLADPRAHAPFPYREDHLEVRWMDARELDFPDESFDVVFSLSSIEHFGSPSAVARAASEMGRVLAPGGHAFIATECFVRRHPLNVAPIDFAIRVATLGRRRRIATPRRRSRMDVFTPRELQSRIVRPSGLGLMQPLDESMSAESWANVTVQSADGWTLETPSGDYYPHVLVQVDRSVFTSVALAMHKPGG